MARKNKLLKKIKIFIILINLKWIKSLKNFYWLETNFMPELQLKQPGLTYTACGLFTKYRKSIQKFREAGNTYI